MSRNFNNDGTAYINLGDVTTARFPQLSAWSYLVFVRVESFAADDQCIGSKTPDTQINLRIDDAALKMEFWRDGVRLYLGSPTYTTNVWYCVSVANDGTGGAGGCAVRTYRIDLTEHESGTFQLAADAADVTGAVVIGKHGVAGADLIDGDIAHVCYVQKNISAQEAKSYTINPLQQVLTWRAEGQTVPFYLPLLGYSPEPDFSGSGNNGTVNGTPTIGNNPPTALYPRYQGWRGSEVSAAGDAGLDTQRKRMSAIAISHYAMSPSVLPDATIGVEDRAVGAYGYYYDLSQGVITRSVTDGLFLLDRAIEQHIHQQVDNLFLYDRAYRTEEHVQSDGLLLDERQLPVKVWVRMISDGLFVDDHFYRIEELFNQEGVLLDDRAYRAIEAMQRDYLLLDETSFGIRVLVRSVSDGLLVDDMFSRIEQHVNRDDLLLGERQYSIIERLEREGLFLRDTSAAFKVASRVVRDELFIDDRQIHERLVTVQDGLLLGEAQRTIQEHIEREGLFLADHATKTLALIQREGLLISEAVYRIFEHLEREGLLLDEDSTATYIPDPGGGPRIVTRSVTDGLLLLDRAYRLEEHRQSDSVLLDENTRRIFEIIRSEGLALTDTFTQATIRAVVQALVWARTQSLDPIGSVVGYRDPMGIEVDAIDPLGITLGHVAF